MPDTNEILQLVRKEMSFLFDISEDRITEQALLYDDLDLDSIDAIDLVVRLQTIANRRISPDQFKSVRTVGDVVTAIEDLLKS